MREFKYVVCSMPSLILPIVRLERSSVEMQSNEKNNDEGMLN